MARQVVAVAALCATVIPAGMARSQSEPKTIEGHLQPELLPEDAVWFLVFDLSKTLSKGKTDPADPDVSNFLSTYMPMPANDGQAFLQVSLATLARVAQVEATPREALSEEALDLLDAQRKAAILAGRDAANTALSSCGRAALARFVAHVRHGMSVTE